MRVARDIQRRPFRHRAAAAILATAALSLGLVATTTGTTSAAPVNASIPASCGGRDKATNDTLALAKGLIGSDKVAVNLRITGGDVPATAGLDQPINAAFDWSATMDQNLIDQGAALIPSITITNIQATQLVRGPSSVGDFAGGNAGPIAIAPKVGVPASLPIGTLGGEIMTTGGGIITYRVGSLQLDVSLAVSGVGNFDLKLKCEVQGSNIIATTTVRDPDAPVFDPQIVQLDADAGETVEVDLLGDVITEGKTPLLPETLRIVEPPAGGTAELVDGVLRFAAPAAGGTYTTTVEVCGAPKPDDQGTPGINETQLLRQGANWKAGLLGPRPIGFTLKVGTEETALIRTYTPNLFGLNLPAITPANWAPENGPGVVGDYAIGTDYKAPSPGDIRSALEALPSIGAGNVEVTKVGGEFTVTFVGAKAEQDVPSIELGQWYAVPPQELLDRISAAIAGLAGSLGGGDPVSTPLDGMTGPEADKYIGDKFLASLTGGPKVTDDEWSAWLKIKVLNPIIEAVPAIMAFINGLFPEKLAGETLAQGEAAIPPQQLCAQGIIEVTVAEVEGGGVTPPASTPPAPVVQGTAVERGGAQPSFVG